MWIKGNKEKSRESGGSGQGKQPWGVGRYGVHAATVRESADRIEVLYGSCNGESSGVSL